MRKLFAVSWMMVILCVGVTSADAQVSNFLIEGEQTGVQVQQGETIQWGYELSTGGTAMMEMWVDKDSNQTLDPTVDFLLFGFQQVDGGQGGDGPPDMDGAENGQVFVEMPTGLAVAHYIMTASENNVADTVDFSVKPMENPVYSIFGNVADENDQGVAWVHITAETKDDRIMPNFWQAFTDSLGNYVIYMDSTAALSNEPWNVRIEESTIGDMVVTSEDTMITITGDHGPVDFTLQNPDMYISGTVLSSDGSPLQERFWVNAWNDSLEIDRGAPVNPDGSFTIGFVAQDIGSWDVSIWSQFWGEKYMAPLSQKMTLSSVGDSLVSQFVVYSIDDWIWGKVTAEGDPVVSDRLVIAENDTTGFSEDTTDADGWFMIPVSRLSNYEVFLDWYDYDQLMNAGYSITSPYPAVAAPGDTVYIKLAKESATFGNLLINNQETGAIARSGEKINWQYDLPVGGKADVEIWVDQDSNMTLNPDIDMQVAKFVQEDNGFSGDGPPDMDGETNGEIWVEISQGLAPAHYLMVVSNDGMSDMADFRILPMQNPVYSVFGQVLDENGNGVHWAMVDLFNKDEQVMPNFWQAFTDSLGNYVIYTDSSAGKADSLWNLSIEHVGFKDMVFMPKDTLIEITGDHGPINFQAIQPKSFVSGTVLDPSEATLPDTFDIWAWNENLQINRSTLVEPDGSFLMAFSPDEFGKWDIGVESSLWGEKYMEPPPQRKVLSEIGDTLFTHFVVYGVEDTIWGEIQADNDTLIDGNIVFAKNDTTGRVMDSTDVDGHFQLMVSDFADQYRIHLDKKDFDQMIHAGYYLDSPYPVYASPGDTVFMEFVKGPTQLGNLLINGTDSAAVGMSGEVINWQYDIPVGGKAQVEIWVDKDSNRTLQSDIDFRLFEFEQQDNGQSKDGPPDMDGVMNGKIWVEAPLGLAPAHYFMIVSENGIADTVDFKVVPMENPVYSIFGRVLDDNGEGIPWVLIDAHTRDYELQPNVWNAFSDSLGNYVIYMDSSAGFSAEPWEVRLERYTIGNLIPDREDTLITVTGDHGPVDFHLSEPDMFVSGTVLDQYGNPLPERVVTWAWNDSLQIDRDGPEVKPSGNFTMGFAEQDTGYWEIGVWSYLFEGQYMEPTPRRVHLSQAGDSLNIQFTVYQADSLIWGSIQADGDPIVGKRCVIAVNDTTGRTEAVTDLDGNFILNVSQFANQYDIFLEYEDFEQFMNAGYSPISPGPQMAAPGDTVIIKFSKSSDVETPANVIPSSFALEQNYPNPLRLRSNQSTTLLFRVPQRSHVVIAIYNLLGQEVIRLLDKKVSPGEYQLRWNGMDRHGNYVSNGLYFVRMITPAFTQHRKILILQ